MRASSVASLAFAPTEKFFQRSFEPADFNVTQALLNNGVSASIIPDPEVLSKTDFSAGCLSACQSLKSFLGEKTVQSEDSSAYDAVISYFWSNQQRDATPRCVVTPEKASDISNIVLISRASQCPFAVRSGGHARFKGASSADGGITVSFEKMKDISLSADKKIASIEPGNLWHDIYTTLAKDNLAVVGGRVAAIGIGGLVTGGGISYFANQYGWACDNVGSYEVVVATGEILTVSPTSYPDLYWALRGGGNNFGIVTKFHLETFAHGPKMFGGQRRFLEPSFPAALDAFVNMAHLETADPKATQFISYALDVTSGTRLAIAELQYADPIAEPAPFEEWRKVEAFADTTEVNTLAHFTKILNETSPKGYRNTYWTATSKLDRHMAEAAFNIAIEEYDSIKDVQGLIPANTLQAVTVQQLTEMQKNGGNALGLTPADGPLLILCITARWDKIEDDERVIQADRNVARRFTEEAKKRGMDHEYLYMNYASEFQDVIGGYGESTEKLIEVARKYDPREVFQKLQPGYFKLAGAPVGKAEPVKGHDEL